MSVITYDPPPTIRDYIRDHRVNELFYDWIVGPVGCLPADSEFLTPAGWKRMDAYSSGDQVAVSTRDGLVSFEHAEYIARPATAPFWRFDSGSLEMELSPEHTVLYDDYRGRRMTDLADVCAHAPSRRTIPTTFELTVDDAPMSDDLIRLRIAFSADGYIPTAGQQRKVTVRKERKKERLRELLAACGIEWTERCYEPRPTETIFTFYWLEADKSLAFVWGLSSRQLAIVLDECLRWDGLNEHTEKRYYTTVSDHADAIQFAAHACGYRAVIRVTDDPRNDAWRTMYTVQIRASDNRKNRAMIRAETRITKRVAEDGKKYCFTTSTGFFVARCGRTIFLTGNSGKTTGLFFKLCYMASLQLPGTDGIRRSRAVVVRNTMPQLKDTTMVSWGYWFKEGQAGEWNATDKIFTLRFSDVECVVLFRPLDTPDDISRVLSLEVNFAIIDEFVEIPRAIIDALSSRVGRYRLPNQPAPSVYGIWGSSNPSTEDNWWFDYLHNNLPDNARYFKQPSGLSDDAENLENLPGGRNYYINQSKGKSKSWINQFIHAEWGFSASGQPVVASFRPELHISKSPLKYNPYLPMIVGLDPGLGGSALIFGQEDMLGRLLVFGELVQRGFSAEQIITNRLRPYVRNRFPELRELIIAPDPAAANRSQSDLKSVVDVFKKSYRVVIESNNRFPLRLDAIEYFTARLVDGMPALQIDGPNCPVLIRALKGGWRYAIDTKKDAFKSAEPEKNDYSHPGDGFGYLARYYRRQTDREVRHGRLIPGVVSSADQNYSRSYHTR